MQSKYGIARMEREVDKIAACALSLPEIADWPELVTLFEERKPRPDWLLPLMACEAVGGDVALAIPCGAAIACLQISIILVDDILDDEADGAHHTYGNGPTANMAVALQAAAFRFVLQADLAPETRAEITSCLAWMAHTTALGQYWDVQGPEEEDEYWKVVQKKSTPFYAEAIHIGALVGGASGEISGSLRDFGIVLGELIQIRDDLVDAFKRPVNPDWVKGCSLPILYARLVEHDYHVQFAELLPRVAAEPEVLEQAQEILIRCGALSFCVYQWIERFTKAHKLLNSLSLVDSSPLDDILMRQARPLANLLSPYADSLPRELAQFFIERDDTP